MRKTRNRKQPQVSVGNQTDYWTQNTNPLVLDLSAFSSSWFVSKRLLPPVSYCKCLCLGLPNRRTFGSSGEDFLPSFRQLQGHQTSADEGGEGQEDGDDLCDADEGRKRKAGKDGRKFTDPVQDAERRTSAESKNTVSCEQKFKTPLLVRWLKFVCTQDFRGKAKILTTA